MECVELDIPVPHVAVVMLNRPPVNALNQQARHELIAVMDELQSRDDVRCLVLTGKGRIFCAGADIKEKADLNQGDHSQAAANRLTRDVFLSVLDSSKPVIGAINGHALGAGMVLASCCDFLLAADTAKFAMPEIDVGQGGGASYLQRVLPLTLMRRMMLTGMRVPATELYRRGVIEECLSADELVGSAVEVAAAIAAKSPLAVRTIRESFVSVEHLPMAEAFKIEQRYTSMLSASPDADEARRAFFEKRRPVF